MKETPILYKPRSVRTTLDGIKTQTRRIMNPQPLGSFVGYTDDLGYPASRGNFYAGFQREGAISAGYEKCPYGTPGDLLWVKEPWRPYAWGQDGDDWVIEYKDGQTQHIGHLYEEHNDVHAEKTQEFWNKICDELNGKGVYPEKDSVMYPEGVHKHLSWRSPLFMPKRAARIWLRINDIRVERLQDISKEDVVREGILRPDYEFAKRAGTYTEEKETIQLRDFFADLWVSINGQKSWDTNPWVWVIEFEVISTTGKPEIAWVTEVKSLIQKPEAT